MSVVYKIPESVDLWLRSGERGISSETIVETLYHFPLLRGWQPDIPRDPADLRRCVLLLESSPETAERFHEMAQVSSRWAAMVEAWPLLEKMLREEVPDLGSPGRAAKAPKTYQAMRKIIEGTANV